VFLFTSCRQEDKSNDNHSEKKEKPRVKSIDLPEIKERGKLRAMTTYSATSYFLYRGEPKGYEYELLKRFADYLDLDLEIVVSQDIDSILNRLNDGNIDLVAHNLAITKDRKNEVKFSEYLYTVKQVLVQRKPENWRSMTWSGIQSKLVSDPFQLIGDTVSVRQNSSYFERLNNLMEEIGGEIFIDTLPGHLSTDEIIKMVVDGEIKYTISDDNIANINASYYPILDVQIPISFSQRIAWAVRPGSDSLLKAVNSWIDQMKKTTDYYVIYNKYFKNQRNFRKRVKSELYSITGEKISPYDALIQKYAESLGWDWRLLASLVYQESRFEPQAESWAEAQGLMQIMPATAEELGISDRADPEQSLSGGTKYLKQLSENFTDIPDSLERIKFTMAAFNCGLGHVLDAQRLAEKRGYDPNKWDDHVAEMILALSYPKNYRDPVVYYGYVRGVEPYTYVSQIFERFGHYEKFIAKDLGNEELSMNSSQK
jgi:membrane-bound lytic murein transglycosylase F